MTALRPAFLALLLGALPASLCAQTAIVDNLASVSSGGDPLAAPGFASAQAFTTGSSIFRLHSVSLKLDFIGAGVVRVKLWSGAGSSPVTEVEDLGSINAAGGSGATQTIASTAKPLLEPNTRYWISVANVSGDFEWTRTTNPANLSGEGTLINLSRGSSDGGMTWPTETTSGETFRFAVFGAPLTPGTVDTAFGADGKGANGLVYAISLQADGKILIGGGFTNVSDSTGTYNRTRIARLHADGSVDTAFGADGMGTSGLVYAVALQADGKILIGGTFTTVSDATGTYNRKTIARLNADGTVDTAFGAEGEGTSGSVNSVAIQADGKILIGGFFTSVSDAAGTHSRDRIARLNPDGTVDTAFGADGKGTDNRVASVAVQDDGKIVIGGFFTTVTDAIGTHNRNGIARLNPNGTVDTTFGAEGKGTNSGIDSVSVQADGKVLIGGNFITVSDAAGTHNRSSIARLNADGTVDTAFGADGKGTDNRVNSVVGQADGKILIGGIFTTVSDASGTHNRSRIARLNADGTVDTAFGADGKGMDLTVRSVSIQADGKILIGGGFTTVSDAAATLNRSSIARLENGTATSQSVVPDLTRVRWLRGGTAPEVDRVIAEVSLDGGLTHTLLGKLDRIAGGWELGGVTIPAACVLRLRAFYANGGTGSGIIDQAISVDLTRSPLLTLAGKTKLTTGKSRLTLRGTASDPDGDLTSVRFKDSGGRWRTAKGTARWTANAKLKRGRNTILIAAYDSRQVASAVERVKVKRR